MANESSSKFIKLVSTGLIDLHLTLTLTDQEAESFNVFPAKLDKMSDCASFLSQQGANLFMTSSQIESKKLNIYDHIRLSSNNPNINTLLVLNRAFKKKIFVEYVTMNEIRFFPEDFFMKDVLKYVTEQNFLFLVENKFLINSHSQIRFEIKINNKTVKLFENICDNSNFDNSIHVDEMRSDSNHNLNNFNINLNHFNNSNSNYENNNNNNENIGYNKYNGNNNSEPGVNLIQNSNDDFKAGGISNSNNNLINESKSKTTSLKKNEDDLKQNSNENIDFSVNNKEEENLLANKSNSQDKSNVASDWYNHNQIVEKETSRLLLENDLHQGNNNTKTDGNRGENKDQRSLGSNNLLLNNVQESPERLQSNTGANNNIKDENMNSNSELRTNSNKDNLMGTNHNLILNKDALEENENQTEEEFGFKNNNLPNSNNLSAKPDADLTGNRLLNSLDNKIVNESNNNLLRNNSINNHNNNLSNKLNNSNNNYNLNPNENFLGENYEALNNKSNNYFDNNNENENLNQNNFIEAEGEPQINYSPLLGIQQRSSFGAAINDLSHSPNTNFTNTLIRTQKTVYERFRYDFSGCNYFFVDLNEIISLQNFNFPLKEFLELLKKMTADFREISIIISFPSIIKNIALLDLESLTFISEIVGLTDIYVFEKKEALALFNLLAQLNSESDSVEEKKNLEFLFIREIKRKKRPYPKLGLFLEGLKKCSIIQQQQNSNLVLMHTDYEFNLIPSNVSSVVFDDYQKIFLNQADHLTSVFLGGFLSRFLYKKSFNTSFTAGNESLKRIIELIRFGVEPPLEFNYYLIRIKKKEKGQSEEQKNNKKKEEKFVLDSTNVVNSKMRDYNPLYDSNLVSFFSSKLTRSHLQKSGFINRNGVIVEDPDHRKVTMIENADMNKNFDKIYEQEKNNLLKIKEKKEKMRMQIKSLMNINSQTLRAGNLRDLDKLEKIYTFNPVLSKKLPNLDLKKSTMKATKFNNNLFLKEISKGNKPKSLFNFYSSNRKNSNSNGNVIMNGHNSIPSPKHASNDIDIQREKSKEKIGYGKTNSNNRITSYNSSNKHLSSKSIEKERENSATYFNNSTNNNNKDRVKSGNDTGNIKISSASRDNDSKKLGTTENDNKRTESNYSKKNYIKTEHGLLDEAEIIKEENVLNANVDNFNNDNATENKQAEENENNNDNKINKTNENQGNDAENNAENDLVSIENAHNLNSSKLSATKNQNNSNLKRSTEDNQENKSRIINGSELVESNNISEQAENVNKVEDAISQPNGENNSQINSSRHENKISNADLNVSKRSKKFDVINNNEAEGSKKIKTEENLLHPEINENNLFSKEEAKENSGLNMDTKRSDDKDKEIDLKDAVSSLEQHPNQID